MFFLSLTNSIRQQDPNIYSNTMVHCLEFHRDCLFIIRFFFICPSLTSKDTLMSTWLTLPSSSEGYLASFSDALLDSVSALKKMSNRFLSHLFAFQTLRHLLALFLLFPILPINITCEDCWANKGGKWNPNPRNALFSILWATGGKGVGKGKQVEGSEGAKEAEKKRVHVVTEVKEVHPSRRG